MSKSDKLKKALKEPISRSEALQIIKSDPQAHAMFIEFPTDYQEKILEFIQGIRGLPLLYDPFFKKVFNPSETPERLERFLSCLMEQKICIVDVIPREGTQMIEKGSLVIMDILVQTEDGSYINVEMQKFGYNFTGERSTCYMSDLVMRQYTQVKSVKKKKFSFRDMKPVYLIVLMEKSSQNFRDVAPNYIHHAHYICDTGAKINFLANYTYVSLDTFHSLGQNIDTYLDAWFTFLSSDDPQDIIDLIELYLEFEEYYHDISAFRTNPKELMNMYSEILAQMDKNTERLMIEEQQQEIERQNLELEEKSLQLEEQSHQLKEQSLQLDQQSHQLEEQSLQLEEMESELSEKDAYIKQLEAQLGIASS